MWQLHLWQVSLFIVFQSHVYIWLYECKHSLSSGKNIFWLIIRIGYPNGLLFLSLFNILTELYLGVVQGHTFHFEIFSGTLNPYWQILVNSYRNFSEISGFRGHELDRFLENWSINFLWVHIQFLHNIGAWARPIFGKLVHIWMSFPEIGLCHAHIFKIKDWMSFPKKKTV